MSDGRAMPAGWLAAMVGALAAIVGCVLFVVWSNQAPDPAPPIPVPTAPAPLPPGTGVELGGEGVEVVQPDPGPGSVATVDEPPTDGVGGEVYVKSPAFKGRQRLNAGLWYPSGGFHGAWDVGVWSGTPVFAARDARVVGARTGVPNRPSGPGGPSNWVLICADVNGKPATLYYQHLASAKVKAGQQVKKGQKLGLSGNSGNSSGPHLHLSAQYLRAGQTCKNIGQRTADAQRYDYLSRSGARIFAPALWWDTRKVIVLKRAHSVEWVARKHDLLAKKLCKLNPAVKNCTAQKRLKAGARVRIS